YGRRVENRTESSPSENQVARCGDAAGRIRKIRRCSTLPGLAKRPFRVLPSGNLLEFPQSELWSRYLVSSSFPSRQSLEGTPPLRLWSLRDRQALRRERVGKWLGNGGTKNAFDARSSSPAILHEDEKRWKVLLARKYSIQTVLARVMGASWRARAGGWT